MITMIIGAVALVFNSRVMASQAMIDRIEVMHRELDCLQFSSYPGPINDSMNDFPNQHMLFLAGRAIRRGFEDQNALANWSGRYIEDGFRDLLIGSLIAKSF